jgi:hypothetical protein
MIRRTIACSALLLALTCASCDVNSTLTGSLDDLEVSLAEGMVIANQMPVPAPDPVACTLTVLVHNVSSSSTTLGVYLPSADVRRASTGELLGTFTFSSDWDGRVSPGETDTVRLVKNPSLTPISPRPCGEYLDLVLHVRNPTMSVKSVTFDSLALHCYY